MFKKTYYYATHDECQTPTPRWTQISCLYNRIRSTTVSCIYMDTIYATVPVGLSNLFPVGPFPSSH